MVNHGFYVELSPGRQQASESRPAFTGWSGGPRDGRLAGCQLAQTRERESDHDSAA
jgi:hypothetical protein